MTFVRRTAPVFDLIDRAGDIETHGTGLHRIKDACDAQGVPVEVFQRGDCVHVRFTRSEAIAGKSTADADNQTAIADNLPDFADNRRQPPITADKFDWRDLPESERCVCDYLSLTGSSSVTEISEALDIPARTLRDVMRKLVDKNIVVAAGTNRNRVYRLR